MRNYMKVHNSGSECGDFTLTGVNIFDQV